MTDIITVNGISYRETDHPKYKHKLVESYEHPSPIAIHPDAGIDHGYMALTADGTLTVKEAGTFALGASSESVFEMQYNGDDKVVVVNGDVTLAGDLTVRNFLLSVGGPYTLIELTNGTLSGSFANINLPATITGSVSATAGVGSDVILTVTAVAGPGDATGEGDVDIVDLDIVGANWGKSDMSWDEGSFDGDGAVDIVDLDILGANWGSSAPIPEPATMALLAMGAVAVLRKRRR